MTKRVIGVDAHVLTGKFQGSRTYLRHILEQIACLDTTNSYIIYSFDPDETARMLPYANFVHKRIAVRSSAPRLLFYWPYIQLRDRLDYLVTHYISPLVFKQRQVMIIHDILYETHAQYFTKRFALQFGTMTRLCAPRARAIITISEATKRSLVQCYGVDPERIYICPPGTEGLREPDATQTAKAFAYKPYVLYVGRLEPRKNLVTLIDAFEKLNRDGLKLIIIGHEDFRCMDVLERIERNPDVIHLKGISDSDLEAFYSNAELFVFPTFAEGFGIPILEAMSHRVPVICSNTTSLPEAGGDLVHYFDPNTEDAGSILADKMRDVLDSHEGYPLEELKEHLGCFTWRRAAKGIVRIFE
ncbi:glycosyltransferase family 1 protein [Thiohalobacter sp. IOR34]|uniref:glycosyltransferase family 4 protein n=1 Tax=Thiohalobacter sp. IOR34 TaxID=3057176 RepID=UPI0025B21A30|nr:glycosyltransferase family 1 protein [Thiohalobacter sp. IOR34]WJW76293.1 glycosyltransferase family 1 protein [Thiohalobacter sp. IOR34]